MGKRSGMRPGLGQSFNFYLVSALLLLLLCEFLFSSYLGFLVIS